MLELELTVDENLEANLREYQEIKTNFNINLTNKVGNLYVLAVYINSTRSINVIWYTAKQKTKIIGITPYDVEMSCPKELLTFCQTFIKVFGE